MRRSARTISTPTATATCRCWCSRCSCSRARRREAADRARARRCAARCRSRSTPTQMFSTGNDADNRAAVRRGRRRRTGHRRDRSAGAAPRRRRGAARTLAPPVAPALSPAPRVALPRRRSSQRVLRGSAAATPAVPRLLRGPLVVEHREVDLVGPFALEPLVADQVSLAAHAQPRCRAAGTPRCGRRPWRRRGAGRARQRPGAAAACCRLGRVALPAVVRVEAPTRPRRHDPRRCGRTGSRRRSPASPRQLRRRASSPRLRSRSSSATSSRGSAR